MSESFIMYESFVDAIETLPVEDQLKAYKAISRYATKGEQASPEIGIAYAIYLMAKPQLDANRKRKEDGEKGAKYGKGGGRPKKPHTVIEENPIGVIDENPIGVTEETPNVNVNVNVNDNVNENVNENVKEKHPQTPSFEELAEERAISEPVKDAVREWLEYKKERREPYKPAGMKALLSQIETKEQEFGASAVIDIIRESMSNGWRGIIWDRLKKPKKEKSLAEEWGVTEPFSLMDGWGIAK